jgi:hypothetical protein
MPLPHPEPDSAQHLLVPFASASAPECHAVLRDLALPNLTALLAALAPQPADTGDDQAFSTPHERALARLLGLPTDDGRIPWAAVASEQPTQPQAWFTPCHFQVGMDQVTLLPGDQIGLEEADSRALFNALAPFCTEDGIELTFESATQWRAQGEPLRDLVCASPDRVSGRSVADWTPSQGRSPLITRLQSEAQMLFYTHAVNDRREAARAYIVNGFWVHGAGTLAHPLARVAPSSQPDSLRQAALRADWAAWRAAWLALDAGVIAQALQQVRGGEPFTLTLCGERSAQTWAPPPSGLGQKIGRFFNALRGAPPAWKTLETL